MVKILWTVLRNGNKVNLSGEQDTNYHGRMATAKFDNVIRVVRTDKEGREYFKFNNLIWYVDELEENGVSYVCETKHEVTAEVVEEVEQEETAITTLNELKAQYPQYVSNSGRVYTVDGYGKFYQKNTAFGLETYIEVTDAFGESYYSRTSFDLILEYVKTMEQMVEAGKQLVETEEEEHKSTTYVYGYDWYDNKDNDGWYTVGLDSRYKVVSKEPLTDEEVIERAIERVTFTSHCKSRYTREERLERTRRLFSYRNVRLLRSY